MNFFLFILLNVMFFVRPYDIVPELNLAEARLYLVIMALCVLTTYPQIVAQLTTDSLSQRPITVCAIGLLGAVALSMVIHGRFDVFDDMFPEFAKVLLYFLLLMAVVDTPARMLSLMGWLVAITIVLAVLGLLVFHEIIPIPSMTPVLQGEYDPETGQMVQVPRLCSMGVFNDPNDFCLILTAASICCRCRAAFASSSAARLMWNCPIALFFYAMLMTQSRGGLIGLMAGVAALFYARFGWKRSLPLTAVLVVVLLGLLGGRQGSMDTGSGTAQERMQLWAEGLSAMLAGPKSAIFGIGAGQYPEVTGGLVAHNSFVHGYVELGMIGGTLFLGAFYLAVWGVRRAIAEGVLDDRPDLAKLQQFVFALVVAYAAGAYSLSRNYVVPTYLAVGWGAAFMAMAYPQSPDWFRFDQQMIKRLCKVGIAGLVFLKLFTMAFASFGG